MALEKWGVKIMAINQDSPDDAEWFEVRWLCILLNALVSLLQAEYPQGQQDIHHCPRTTHAASKSSHTLRASCSQEHNL